jgi:16S rRNA C967 or C1407 C5-methylase (RsmB/RsmF family)
MALKPGGTLVYSTCSINPLENDGVLEKLVRKQTGFKIIDPLNDGGEKTQYGRIFMPDREPCHGPLFISRLIKSI